MDHRSLSRELSLISLGLIRDDKNEDQVDFLSINFEATYESAIEFLINHCREELAECEVI